MVTLYNPPLVALQIGIGNFSGAIASNIYRAKDAPHYVLGSTCCCSRVQMPLVLLILLQMLSKLGSWAWA